MYGHFAGNVYGQLVDNEESCRCLKFGDLKGEIESIMFAAQEHILCRNSFKNKIFKEEIDMKCWFCK
jgi:hypothetical protein